MSDGYDAVLSHTSDVEDDPEGLGSVWLETHLCEVGERARKLVLDGATTSEGDDLGELAELLGRLHDIGKLTTFFQEHVRGGSPEEATHHARLGAFVAYYALDECGYSQQTRIAGTVAVWKHHGALPDVETGLKDELSDDTETGPYGEVCKQAGNIQRHRPDLADRLLADAIGDGATDDAPSWSEFLRSVPDVRKAIRDAPTLSNSWGAPSDVITEDTYTDTVQLSSALVLADKSCAGKITDERLKPETAELNDLKSHLDDLGGDPKNDEEETLNRLRDAAQDEVAENVQRFLDGEESVATVTLPTGYGKTLVGLRAALEMQAERDTDGRVVYALPFTSIIDQTAETLWEVFDADPTGRGLTIHHHLAETVTVGDESEEDDSETARDADDPTDEYARDEYLVGESWRSGTTLTTFVQLFESLAGPGNAQSMKLPALYGSVVVVDEPQALPLRWWPLVERLVEVLTEVYDARVVLMTATQPEIVDSNERFDLIREKDRYFDGPGPDRVRYEFDSTATADDEAAVLGYDEAASRLVAAASEDADSALAVCNTIDSAQDLSKAVAERVDAESLTDVNDCYANALGDSFAGPESTGELVARIDRETGTESSDLALLHLSTRLRPCDRRALLQIAEELTALDVPLVVVSTQLIEAGVDISFDRVYRDFAPLDSIVQAAGRCNRSFEREEGLGNVSVWQLDAPDDCEMLPSKAVYARPQKPGEKNLLAPTRDALDETVEDFADEVTASEATVADEAVETYHCLVGHDVTPDGIDMVDDFENAQAKSLRQKSLIDQHLAFEVYVCRTETESERVEELRDAREERAFERVKRLRKDLAELRVSVPVYRPDSEAARKLKNAEPLFDYSEGSDRTGWDHDTERVLDPERDVGRFEQYFDVREGVHLPESGVEARFF
ncbi:CRISPR-associated endonuclease Cas3'' [Halorussus pelagicus]|uniref:CRISPR-associated endonuclease Cas3'' n=1 Tax=Halorussus pelagicus TaxID=2505977 RepID=UPI000FFB7F55|nr:CRISPR-associated endonuclease Cas3'' [Halorussus pelagicus]